MNIENRQKLLTVVAGAVIALFVGDKMIISPLIKSWKERSAKILELRRSIAQGASTIDRDKNIRSRWDNIRTNTLPTEISVAESQMFEAVTRWSQESRVNVSGIKPQWKRKEDDYMTLEYRIDASGSLSTLTRFLFNVEKDPLAVRVESVEFNSHEANGQQLTMALQVSGLVLAPAQ